MTDTEVRTTPVECRVVGGGKSMTVAGYGVVFGLDSSPLPVTASAGDTVPHGVETFIEQVAPTFLNAERDAGWPGAGGGVISCYNHSYDLLLGSVRAGTLRLEIDYRGLHYKVDLPSHRSDVYELVSRGDVSGSSFAFKTLEDEWSYADGKVTRTLVSGKLYELGPVTVPAYPDATAAIRSLSRYANAPIGDVERCANSGELRRFFTRSDRPPVEYNGASGRLALIRTMEMQRTGTQARVELEALRPRSGPDALAQLDRMKTAT